jgi:hypothetical protein
MPATRGRRSPPPFPVPDADPACAALYRDIVCSEAGEARTAACRAYSRRQRRTPAMSRAARSRTWRRCRRAWRLL